MYAIYDDIYHQYTPNVSIYTIHGSYGIMTMIYDRRKFRSQTSDNMDRWKSRGGKSQREEEQKRERVRRKTMQVREKVAKSRNTVFFQ